MGPVEFLDTVFEGRTDQYICIWTKGETKESHWINNTGDVLDILSEHEIDDIYVGVGLVAKPKGRNVRAKKRDVVGIPGLWIDIDVANSEVEDKKLRPQTREDALKAIEALPEPTIMVNSGFGIHCWWLFESVWLFESDEERDAAQVLAESWNRTIQEQAKDLGFDIDSTYDLSRVLRLPGSANWKGDGPKQVAIDRVGEYRYEIEYLSAFLTSTVSERSTSQLAEAIRGEVESTFTLDPNAEPPFQKFDVLLTNNDKFEKSWNRTRRDMSAASPSEYDNSLAAFAARAGWDDQEIVNLLIAHRRRHGDDLKLRYDYYRRTLTKIRAQMNVDEDLDIDVVPHINVRPFQTDREPQDSEEGGGDKEDEPDDYVPTDEEVERREKALQYLRDVLDLPIDEIIKYTSQPPRYRMIVAGHGFMVGDIEHLISQPKFRNKIAGELGVYIRRRKEEDWGKVAQLLLNACTNIEVTHDQREAGMVEAWLISYLSERAIFPTPDEAALQNQPFWYQNKVHIYADEMRRWLWTNRYTNVDRREFTALLRAYGCKPVRINLVMQGKRTTRSSMRVTDYITDIFKNEAMERGIISEVE